MRGTCVLEAYVSVCSGAPQGVCWYTEGWGGTRMCTVVHLTASACAWRSADAKACSDCFPEPERSPDTGICTPFILGTCSRASSEVVAQITKEGNCVLYQPKSLK